MARTKLYAGTALATLALASPAFAHLSAAPAKVVGNPKAGKTVFTTNCGACHTLKAAGALGNIGPNLDKAAKTLTEATIVKAVTKGGSSVMTKAAAAKYSTMMVAYGGVLSKTQIQNVAAFVYTSTHK
jgi:mono/diheme cytochrome c family protein